MIATISLFTLLLLQLTQVLTWVVIFYILAILIRFPIKYFWGAITHKTHL